uniref:DNA replication complex GINS protein PSF3 n=1 Tax=Pristionchus pacificus TaxID=54126 RepID=A0A8R1V5N8_PRIPA
MMDPNTEQDVEENFYNIDDVVALDSHVSCSFESTTPQGILQILGINQNEAGKETKAEAPLWILPTIVSHCNFRLPKAFNEEIQGVLTSHASAANLEQLQADYYTVGMNLSKQVTEGKNLAKCLVSTFTQRIGNVIGPALQGKHRPARCDSLEKKLFDLAAKARKESQKWQTTTDSKKRKLLTPKN